MERTSIYRAIAPLEADGMVTLGPDPDDARAKLAALTAGGRSRIRQTLPHWQEAQRSFVSSVGRARWMALARELSRVVRQLQQ